MQSLQDVYNQIASQDVELEKRAGELLKQAEEEDAAGRITARGFADELAKLAANYTKMAGDFNGPGGAYQQKFNRGAAETIKSKPGYDLGNAGKSGQGYTGGKGPGHQASAPKPGGNIQMPASNVSQSVNRPGQNRSSIAGSPYMGKTMTPPAKPPTVAAGAMKPPGA